MKRSEINLIMRNAIAFFEDRRFHLPPFAYWTPQEWKNKGEEVREIVDNCLGWDITDFGKADFERTGLFLFTIRNGDLKNQKSGTGKVYCEKILIVANNQLTPLHFHWKKTEDIINRGGGKLALQLYTATEDEELSDSNVTVSIDGVVHTFKAGETLELKPGESITIPPLCYHNFRGVEGRVLVGEVSSVNDDFLDNRFYEQLGRFPDVEEDEPPLHLLVSDYDEYYHPNK